MMYMIHIIYICMNIIYYIYMYVCVCTSIYCTCKYLGHASISATKKGHHPISNVARFKEQRWTEALRGCSFPAKQHPFLWK